MSYSVHKLYNY